jgi:hypothetical protein
LFVGICSHLSLAGWASCPGCGCLFWTAVLWPEATSAHPLLPHTCPVDSEPNHSSSPIVSFPGLM